MASNDSAESHSIVKIDEEICLLKRRITHLLSQRNALIPIGHIPADVLERILDIARHQGTHTLHLSWVSQSWRAVTMGSKTLWTLINESNMRWSGIYLERSFPVPLIIRFGSVLRGLRIEVHFSKIIDQLPRIQEITLPDGDHNTRQAQIVEKAFALHGSTPLPHLKSLGIEGGRMPQEMLSALQNAHRLSFRNCRLDWTVKPLLFPYLHSLSLSLYLTTQPSLPRLLDYLENMPALKSLTLLHAVEQHSDQYLSMARCSSENGPKLDSLTVATTAIGFQSNMLFLQKSGCITRNTKVSMKVNLCQDQLDQVRIKLETFNEWATNIGYTQGITHLGLDKARDNVDRYSDTESIIIEYGAPCVTSASVQAERGYAHLNALVCPVLTNDIVAILPQHLPLKNLHLLWINIQNHTDTSPWQVIVGSFGRLPHLVHLSVYAPITSPLIGDLLDVMSVRNSQILDDEASNHHDILFPALKHLVFPYRTPCEDRLRAYLRFRNAAGLKLVTLTLPTSHDVEQLLGHSGDNADGLADEIIDMQGRRTYLTGTEQDDYQFVRRMKDML